MKSKAKRVTEGRGSSTVNGQVPPRRLANAERRPREYLTPDEVDRLMIAAQKRIGARNPHRDATMILIAYRHGLRASELTSLRWDMLDLAQGRYHVTRRKNGRPSGSSAGGGPPPRPGKGRRGYLVRRIERGSVEPFPRSQVLPGSNTKAGPIL